MAIVDNQSLKTQSYIDSISSWTTNQKMVLIEIKTKAMIVNFTEKYQFYQTKLEQLKSLVL